MGRYALRFGLLGAVLLLAAGCGGSRGEKQATDLRDYSETGIASWYGKKYHGRTTASGEKFDMRKMTAAHKTLPFGVIVRVTNLDNGRRLKVKINDRGPFVEGRIIDLSRGAAKKLDMFKAGLARVRLEVVR